MMDSVFVRGVGLFGPGLAGWQASAKVLAGRDPYQATEVSPGKAELLPPNERRRVTATIQMAFQVATEVIRQADVKVDQLAAVFSSSAGDTDIADQISTTLSLPGRPVSPTQFHNSVHNAPAGYWAIATKSHWPSASIAAGDAGFAAGLLEAVQVASLEHCPVLLVVYDIAVPTAFEACGGIRTPFAVGVLLDLTQKPDAFAQLTLKPMVDKPETTCRSPELESLRCTNPAARCLPLLSAWATGNRETVWLPYLWGRCLEMETSPC